MNGQKRIHRVHEGQYVAEVEVTLTDFDAAWGPYLDNKDVIKLDKVRRALRAGDIAEALKYALVYRLEPVSAA